jgi:acyl-coenzyme A thioesterase PaaI-like protein
MDDQAGLKILRDEIAVLKERGDIHVTVDALDKRVAGLLDQAGVSHAERLLQTQYTLAQYEAQERSNIESFKAAVESGREALNALVLINGGAVVALLGFVGAMAARSNGSAVADAMRAPLLRFGTGVLLGGLAFGSRYLSQALDAGVKKRWAFAFNLLSIALAISGYVVFALGLAGASDAIIAKVR